MFFQKKIKIVTHNGFFHTDDVFSAALLEIVFDRKLTFTRTRDVKLVEEADYVFDIGGIHDPIKNRFDHHQPGGAGKRENGIPYASFGLLWKNFGEQITASKQAAIFVEEKLVMPVDALDNGKEIFAPIPGGIEAYLLENVVNSFRPTWKESEDEMDECFRKAVVFAKALLVREVKRAKDKLEALLIVEKAYATALDKRVIVFDRKYPWDEVIKKYPDPLFVVHPILDNWRVYTVRKNGTHFQNRKDFHKAWAGKRDEELAHITGVPDAVFCHNGLFLAVAKTKQGALRLAQLALQN